jgi:predicted DNA-binding protein
MAKTMTDTLVMTKNKGDKPDRFDVYVRLDEELSSRLDRQVEAAQRTMPGLSKASVIRAAILFYVEHMEQQAETKRRR